MIVRHLESIDSTQNYLLENLSIFPEENILISTSNQRKGTGRTGNTWEFYPKSLAFSFTLKPTKIITLTSVELAVHLVNFFNKYFDISLKVKWPNDLYDAENRKCGGIICNYKSNQLIIAGIGINIIDDNKINNNFQKFNPGFLYINKEINNHQKTIPMKLYKYILHNRLNDSDIINSWKQNCIHMNKEVKIISCKNEIKGIFSDIGRAGEAIITPKDGGTSQKIISGSLFF